MPLCLGTAFSLTLFCVLPSRISASMSLLELLQGPVWAPRSAPAGEEILDTDLMRRENPIKVPVSLTRVNNHGVNSLEIGRGQGHGRGSNPHQTTNHINDNYCSVPTQLSPELSRSDHKLSQLNQTVHYLVVNKCKETENRTDFNRLRLQKGCILSRCCQSCSYCNFSRAAAKERLKSRSVFGQNKTCKRCLLCKSVSFCPLCSKCPTCCHRDHCRGKASEFLASLAKFGVKSQSGVHFKRRLHSALQGKATSQLLSLDCKQVCQPTPEQVFYRSFDFLDTKASGIKFG